MQYPNCGRGCFLPELRHSRCTRLLRPPVQKESGPAIATKVLMIIRTVIMGISLIPLARCLPMTLSYSKKIKKPEPISTGFKICTLLFVNNIAGILMLCDKDNESQMIIIKTGMKINCADTHQWRSWNAPTHIKNSC